MAREDELLRQNELLNEQIKGLVRAEKRLYRTQHFVETQLHRIRTLNEFVLNAPGSRSEAEILAQALELFYALFPVQAIVVTVHDGGRPRPARDEGSPPRPSCSLVRVARAPAAPAELPASVEGMDRCPLPDHSVLIDRREAAPHLVAILDWLDQLAKDAACDVAPDHPAYRRADVALPLGDGGGGMRGLLVCSMATHSYHDALVVPDDRPFLDLVCKHVTSALVLFAKNRDLEVALAHVEENARLKHELEIGGRIQTCIVPARIDVPGLEVAARMLPASEVGGDYYDLFPVEGGAWIGIGDVAGHGLTSGLVMLMLQSAFSAAARMQPDAPPSAILLAVNAVLFENIRHRLRRDEHVTLSLLRYHESGRVVFAGAHEELIVLRARTGRCELVETPGTWVGARRDIGRFTVDTEMVLAEGDVLVLYTDGVTEAMDAEHRQFGLERLTAVVAGAALAKVEAIRDRIFDAVERWTARRDDDLTVVVLRHLGRRAASAD
jgi:serine phosphatase RsbU (regulator of sigma subunit)